ncbi:nucleotidyltransferase family protein [Paenisporosarcina indica]|uniref:nucleotidyltransferase family protein n=1 Tax=Paenisporosarcina indica TaxID=650093 RepID=UPI00094FCE2F|nr:nucleotidyltransferase family protein [Paenisporosarcina indica]
MKLLNEQDLVELIVQDEWMMKVLEHAQSLSLPDWWICAGFVRSKVWDTLHGFEERTKLPDVDVIYFESNLLDEEIEKQYENELNRRDATIPWSVKNQARMHKVNQVASYQSSTDGISKFPETATAIGIKLDEKGDLRVIAPYGVEDLIAMKICPTPYFKESQIFQDRLLKKKWSTIWPKLTE